MDDQPKPIWEKQPGETGKAFAAFQVYLYLRYLEANDAGKLTVTGSRSHEKTRERLGKSSGYLRQIEQWSSKYDWVARAAAYDADMDRQASEKNQALWLKRNEQVRELEFGLAIQLFGRGHALLAHPTTEVKTLVKEIRDEQGNVVQQVYKITIPADWKTRDIPGLLQTASKLGRLATGAETDRKRSEVTGKDGGVIKTESTQVVVYIPDNGRDDDGDG